MSYIELALSPSSSLLVFYSIYFSFFFFSYQNFSCLESGLLFLSLMPMTERDMDEGTKERDEAFSTKIIRMCSTHKRHTTERLKITQASSPKAYLSLTSFLKGRTPVWDIKTMLQCQKSSTVLASLVGLEGAKVDDEDEEEPSQQL